MRFVSSSFKFKECFHATTIDLPGRPAGPDAGDAGPGAVRSAPEAKSDKPSVILRFAPLDQLRADLRYLAEMVGQKETAGQLDALLKSKIGDKGLEGD